jgi:hypothetical protein
VVGFDRTIAMLPQAHVYILSGKISLQRRRKRCDPMFGGLASCHLGMALVESGHAF